MSGNPLRPEEPGRAILICDVRLVTEPDLATIDMLSRLQLCARRLECSVHLRNVSPALAELLDLVGLAEVVPMEVGSGLRLKGQSEKGKETFGVEEEVEPDDPTR
jgi:anti-anti-sigma regulatory factor